VRRTQIGAPLGFPSPRSIPMDAVYQPLWMPLPNSRYHTQHWATITHLGHKSGEGSSRYPPTVSPDSMPCDTPSFNKHWFIESFGSGMTPPFCQISRQCISVPEAVKAPKDQHNASMIYRFYSPNLKTGFSSAVNNNFFGEEACFTSRAGF